MAEIKNIEVANAIKAYINAVKQKFNIEKVYLFGSYLSGSADEESDIDLAIISFSFTGNIIVDNAALSILTWGIDTRIEPIAFKPEHFNSENMIADEIIKTGVEIPID